MRTPPRTWKTRSGFTLAEVLVVLAIVAIMAAVLLPVLTKQIRKGDVGRVVSDLSSIQTGLEAYLSDVRRIPASLDDLLEDIGTASPTPSDINSEPYPQGLLNRWRGPYLNKETLADGTFPTGFGGRISTTLSIGTDPHEGFATLTILDLTEAEFDELDFEIDGEVHSTAGRFTRAGTLSIFRLMPID